MRSISNLLAVSALLLLPGGALLAQGETGDFCVRDYLANAGCSANDVRIEQLSVVSVVEDCETGVVGEATVIFEALVSADGSPDRYDIGLFLALDGGSAFDGDACYHDYLDPPLTATPVYGDDNGDLVDDIVDGPWWDGSGSGPDDSDTCGDIESDTQVIKTLAAISVVCADSNGDGSADVAVCTSWDNQVDNNCSSVQGAAPGAPSKCSCPDDPVELGIPPDPELTVTKSPDTQTILAGGTAVFTITVESNTFLTDVVVDDPLCTTLTGPVGDDGDDVLETSETWTYTCTRTNVLASYTNTVEVDATSPNGPVSDSDTADVIVEAPSIAVVKDPDQSVAVGGTANFTITVDNDGNVALTGVVVSDPQCTTGPTYVSGDGNNNGILDTTETWTYSCSVSNVQSGFVNTATATGTPPTGPDVTDSDDATVTVDAPSITVEKDPPTQTIRSGDDASFTITVTNSGNTDLSDVGVTDANCTLSGPSGDTGNDGILSVGESWTYTCSTQNVVADFTNTVDVEAEACPPCRDAGACLVALTAGCPTVEDSDTADVDVIDPELTVSKTPDDQTVVAGNDANFTITVENTGDADLTNVVLDDPNCSTPVGPAGDDGDSVLEVGETWTYTCSTVNVTQDFTNTATATGTPPVGSDVSDSDDAAVDVVTPSVTASKASSLAIDSDGDGVLSSGDTLEYTVNIVNNGDGDAVGIVFNDTPDLNTALVVGSVTTTQGTVIEGNTAGDTGVSVDVGTLPASGGSATVVFRVTIDEPFPQDVTEVVNQGVVSGTDIPDIPTDDPADPEPDDPTDDPVAPDPAPPLQEIPTLGAGGAALFALLAALAGWTALRRRRATAG
jgi:uncharacterized repeat protein (TIGR01451 family)